MWNDCLFPYSMMYNVVVVLYHEQGCYMTITKTIPGWTHLLEVWSGGVQVKFTRPGMMDIIQVELGSVGKVTWVTARHDIPSEGMVW